MAVEQIRLFEPRRVVHFDLGAELPIAKIGPVANFAIANANDVGESIAGEIRQEDRLCAVRKYDGGAIFFFECFLNTSPGAQASPTQRGIPTKNPIFTHHKVPPPPPLAIYKLPNCVFPLYIST